MMTNITPNAGGPLVSADDAPMLAAALRYAARGWRVFPCSPETKQPLVKGDTGPDGKTIPKTGGVKKASTDAGQIKDWWGRWPAALIGVAMGPETGLFAVDFDPRTDADSGEVFTLERLKAETEAMIGGPLPKTVTAVTQSGGVHVYFAWPDDGGLPIRNRGNLPRHVDVRGEGGYVIMPPSRMDTGKLYRWRHAPETTEAVQAPAALLALLRSPGKVGSGLGSGLGSKEDGGDAPAASKSSYRPSLPGSEDMVTIGLRRYVMAAADAEVAILRATGDGDRNNQLNASAYALGQLAGTGHISTAMARAMLDEVARTWPNIEKSLGTIESGFSAGLAVPRNLDDVAADMARVRSSGRTWTRAASPAVSPAADDDIRHQEGGPTPPDEGAISLETSQMGGWRSDGGERGKGAAALDSRGAYLPRTDLGNAERWQLRHGADFRQCPEMGWLAWDGRRWSRENADAWLVESVFETVRSIQHEADWIADAGTVFRAGLEGLDGAQLREAAGGWNDALGCYAHDPDQVVKVPARGTAVRVSDALRSWGRASESGGRIEAVARLAETLASARMEVFDADPWKLNVGNGTLHLDPGDLRRGGQRAASVRLQAHRREDMITMLAPVCYAPLAGCPDYDAFMARVQPDEAVRRFLHAWAGYSLTGDASEQKFVINHGAQGANGKSTWIDTLAEMIGDYAIAVNIAVFMDEKIRSGSAPSPDLAELPRKRLVRTSEPPKGVPFAEALVKLVTGGEPLAARQLNRPFFRFVPEFKITVSMNPVPQLSDDPAIWRRTRVVPWDVSIPEAERDSNLKDKLRAEGPGILNRLVSGFMAWADFGLPDTEAVTKATQQVRDSLDPLGKFLRSACAVEPEARVGSSQLYEVFKAWCVWAGEREWTQTGFSKALANRGFDKMQSNTMQFLGLRLVRGVDDYVDRYEGKWVARGELGPGPGAAPEGDEAGTAG